MKAKHILNRPTPVTELDDMHIDDFAQDWSPKMDRIRLKQWRKLKQELA